MCWSSRTSRTSPGSSSTRSSAPATQGRIVGSGDAALRAVAERPPDLIILDLNLPVLSGTEVCRILRARPATADLPIIMLTARTGESRSRRRAGPRRGRLRDQAVQPARARRRASGRCCARPAVETRPAAAIYRGEHLMADFDAVAVAVDGEPSADAARVRAAAVPGREPEPRAVARPAARARLGLRPVHRDPIGGRARRPAARQAGHRRRRRSKPSSGSATDSSSDGAGRSGQLAVAWTSGAHASRCARASTPPRRSRHPRPLHPMPVPV